MTDKPPEKLTEVQREKLIQALDKVDQDILAIEHELLAMGYTIPALALSRSSGTRARLQKCRGMYQGVARPLRFEEKARRAR